MPLPSIVIAGERRSGTTSLAKWLEVHPDVFLHPRLDMAYFVDDAVVGCRQWFEGEVDAAEWDRTHSVEEYAELFEHGRHMRVVGEKSADYLFWQPSHERLARYLPDTKYVITLRHPVERAWSHYWNEVGKGRETLPFAEALDAEESRCRRSAYARDHLSYRSRGMYAASLEHFRQHIPAERTHIVILEECLADPRATLGRVFEFMGVDPERGLERAGQQFNANWTTVPRAWARRPVLRLVDGLLDQVASRLARTMSRDVYKQRKIRQRIMSLTRQDKTQFEMPETTYRQLCREYEPQIVELERRLQRPLDCWRRAA